LDDVIQGFSTLEQIFRDRRDRRAIFVTAYLNITLELKRRVDENLFLNAAWVARYAVAFANLYRIALLAFDRGDLQAVPKPWRIAFATSANDRGSVLQDLLLGINAHINHDLPLALLEVTIDPEREKRYTDHTTVNQALKAATGPVQDRISELYAPVLSLLDRVLGVLDEDLTNFSFEKARENAWVAGVSLANARDDQERLAIRQNLADRSAVLAQLILSPTLAHPSLYLALRHLERVRPWWRYIFPDLQREAELQKRAAAVIPGVPPEVHTIDELIERLEETVARFDRQRSKMSIYPTIYLLITRKFKEAIEAGQLFEDSDWLARLDLEFANLYFGALAAFEAGRIDVIPQCWATAFQAMVDEDSLILQNVILAVNARLNYDLAIALLRAGIDDDMPKRRRDLERIHVLFEAAINPTQDVLARKYSRFLKFLDLIGGKLDELVIDFSYTQARDGAWENAVALTREPSAERRQVMLHEIDQTANALAQKILLRGVMGADWIIQALRHIEKRFEGDWSEWVRDIGAPAGTVE
jgi:hypothetical protein